MVELDRLRERQQGDVVVGGPLRGAVVVVAAAVSPVVETVELAVEPANRWCRWFHLPLARPATERRQGERSSRHAGDEEPSASDGTGRGGSRVDGVRCAAASV